MRTNYFFPNTTPSSDAIRVAAAVQQSRGKNTDRAAHGGCKVVRKFHASEKCEFRVVSMPRSLILLPPRPLTSSGSWSATLIANSAINGEA